MLGEAGAGDSNNGIFILQPQIVSLSKIKGETPAVGNMVVFDANDMLNGFHSFVDKEDNFRL